MAKGDTFFLRARIDIAASTATYQSDSIDISAYTDPSRGRVLVVDRGFVTFTGDGPAPLVEADINAGANSRACMTQALSEVQTDLVSVGANNAVFMENTLYAATDGTSFTMMDQMQSLNPIEYTGGFIIPTDQIFVGAKCDATWAGALKVNYLFEVHTETLSLRRIQELLVSLTAN
jgi:hypothetical protein